jgi:hypothetical protein
VTLSLAQLEAVRARHHRLDPSVPMYDAAEAVAFIVERGVVMASGKSSLPTLTEAIVGHSIKGSWMADPEVQRVYDLWMEMDKSAAIASAPLVQGKQVYYRADLADAVRSIAGNVDRRTRAIAALKPLERQLRRRNERRSADGRVGVDQRRHDEPGPHGAHEVGGVVPRHQRGSPHRRGIPLGRTAARGTTNDARRLRRRDPNAVARRSRCLRRG